MKLFRWLCPLHCHPNLRSPFNEKVHRILHRSLIRPYQFLIIPLISLLVFADKIYQSSVRPFIDLVSRRQLTVTYRPEEANFHLSPLLAFWAWNIDTNSCQWVRAVVDTGSAHSFIASSTVEDLKLETFDVPKTNQDGSRHPYVGEQMVRLSVSGYDDPEYPNSCPRPIEHRQMELLVHDDRQFLSGGNTPGLPLMEAICDHYNIAIADRDGNYPLTILIGCDLYPTILQMPACQCISNINISSNMSLMATSLGYYLQGQQGPSTISKEYFNFAPYNSKD